METRVLIVEKENGWAIFDAELGDTIAEGLLGFDESLKLCEERHYVVPFRKENGDFFTDLDGEPLYRTSRSKTEEIEFEYADGTPCLDFELCPDCNGPAFGRDSGGHNCYYCPNCEKDVDCVPPAEWIGAVD